MKDLNDILKDLPENVALIAVSKSFSTEEVQELYKQGQRAFGENRVQELARKNEILQKETLIWHFIGRLQTNKINHLLKIPFHLWQSCESLEMAKEVDKRSDRIINVLLQVNSAEEASKQGIPPALALEEYLKIQENCKNINLQGIMSIGAMSEDKKEIEKSFKITYKIFEEAQKYGAKICSMGMSSDYKIAIDCGSNMIRLGSILK